MSVIAVLIGCSILVAAGFLAAFLWAVRTGQYDDKYTPSMRILFDDAAPKPSRTSEGAKERGADSDDAKGRETNGTETNGDTTHGT